MNDLGKLLVLGGILMIVAGIIVTLVGRLPAGMLPGDIFVQRKNGSFYFPVVTCIVISIVLTVVLNFIGRR